jgi:hypothetical protein
LNSFKVYKSIREIPESEWIHFVPTSRYFLSYQYLSTLEKSSPELDYIYVLYYKNNILKGLVSFQVVDFKGDALRKYIPDTNFLVKFILNKGLDCIQSKLLVLGNLIFTCETGWYFDPLFSEPHRDKILFEMIRIARKQIPKNTIGIMINEASGIRQHHSYKCQGFHLFEVENKMVFKSRLFSNFSEYDEKLISKYRVRKNKIFQLNKNIEFFEINVLNFEMYQNEIQDLFNNVIEKSKFKLLVLNKDYFKIFLEEQSQTFKLVGFRENNTLLGFVSYFEINQEMEVLIEFSQESFDILKPKGRLSVISYHSLEDRLVKRFMRNGLFEGEPEKDFYGHFSVPFKIIEKLKVPTTQEITLNNRARSAKLRVAEKK